MTDTTEQLLIRAERLLGDMASLLSDIRAHLGSAQEGKSGENPENQPIVSDTELRAAVVSAVKSGRMISSDITSMLSSYGARVVTDIKDPQTRREVLRALS